MFNPDQEGIIQLLVNIRSGGVKQLVVYKLPFNAIQQPIGLLGIATAGDRTTWFNSTTGDSSADKVTGRIQ